MFRIGKSIDTEGRLVVVRGCGEGVWGVGTGFLFRRLRMFWK